VIGTLILVPALAHLTNLQLTALISTKRITTLPMAIAAVNI
jgi:hypothetical protein